MFKRLLANLPFIYKNGAESLQFSAFCYKAMIVWGLKSHKMVNIEDELCEDDLLENYKILIFAMFAFVILMTFYFLNILRTRYENHPNR